MSASQSVQTNPVAVDAAALSLEQAIHSSSSDVLATAASDVGLNEDLALTLLRRNDLSSKVLEHLSKNGGVMKSRKVKLAVVQHPKTPRHVALPLLRHLFTFELMRVALEPVALADIKRAAEEALLGRLETISAGEKLTLARRASGRVAGALLLDSEPRVVRVALENPHLTEASVVKAILRPNAPVALVQDACHDRKWSLRREVRIALLRSENTPLARALVFVRGLPSPLVKEILQASSLPENIKSHLAAVSQKATHWVGPSLL